MATVYQSSLPVMMKDLGILRNTVELSISVFVIGASTPVLVPNRMAMAVSGIAL